MKRILPFTLLLIVFSCLTEESADPGKASTFIRYYNGGFDDQAQAFEETPDKGYIILATTQITDNNATVQRSKIKLIKTDPYGNQVWQTLYPEFSATPSDLSYYKGRGILVEKDGAGDVTGYTIVGDSIDRFTGVSYLCIVRTDANGENPEIKSLDTMPYVQGQSITKDAAGNYIVLGSRSNAAEDMVLAEFSQIDLSLSWSRDYGNGVSRNITGLIIAADNSIFWGGTVTRDNSPTAMRFIRTMHDEEGTAFDRDYGLAEFNEETGGICPSFGSSFSFVGTTDQNGNKDILYKKLSTAGDTLSTKIIGDDDPQEGNAICRTSDEGLLIIGTTGLDDAKDYYLIKLNFLGAIQWSRIFGSNKADKGVSVKQVSDGSYVILGATNLGGLGSIMLRKTDSKGNIE